MAWGILIALHMLAAVVWIGGMFFVTFCLRPSCTILAPVQRVALFAQVLPRFFIFVAVSITLLFATGYWAMFSIYGGFGKAPVYVDFMQLTALLMTVFACYVLLVPYPKFRTAAQAEDVPAAAAELNTIRLVVLANLTLGVITAVLGAAGPYWA